MMSGLVDRWIGFWAWCYPEAADALHEAIEGERRSGRLGPGFVLRVPLLARGLALAERRHPTLGGRSTPIPPTISRLRLAIAGTVAGGLVLAGASVVASVVQTGNFVFESAPATAPVAYPRQARPSDNPALQRPPRRLDREGALLEEGRYFPGGELADAERLAGDLRAAVVASEQASREMVSPYFMVAVASLLAAAVLVTFELVALGLSRRRSR
jgi:hypothetical protein